MLQRIQDGLPDAANRGGGVGPAAGELAGEPAVLADRQQLVAVAQAPAPALGDHFGAVHPSQQAGDLVVHYGFREQRQLSVQQDARGAADDRGGRRTRADAAGHPHRHRHLGDQLLHQDERAQLADPAARFHPARDKPGGARRDGGAGLRQTGHFDENFVALGHFGDRP